LDGRKPVERRDRRRITEAIAATAMAVVSVFTVVGGVAIMIMLVSAADPHRHVQGQNPQR
jgi:CHASE3 domain sensor protein